MDWLARMVLVVVLAAWPLFISCLFSEFDSPAFPEIQELPNILSVNYFAS